MTKKKKCKSTANSHSRSFNHFDHKKRVYLACGLNQNLTQTKISDDLEMDKASVSREIQRGTFVTQPRLGYVDCAVCKGCKILLLHKELCTCNCEHYVRLGCELRDTKGLCNGCPRLKTCSKTKLLYDADKADEAAQKRMLNRYDNCVVSDEELERIQPIVKKGLKLGNTPFEIVSNYPDIGISVPTLYNYLNNDVFARIHKSLKNLWEKHKKQINRTEKEEPSEPKEERTYAYLEKRGLPDLYEFLKITPGDKDALSEKCFTYMDVVFIGGNHGPYIQTFLIEPLGLMIGFLHQRKTKEEMVKGINMLEEILGKELFDEYCSCIITDQGKEFADAEGIETSPIDGRQRTHIFYCDAGCPGQKAEIENAHLQLRRIFPKGVDHSKKNVTQEKVNKAFSVIASKPRTKAFNNMCDLDFLKMVDADLYNKLDAFGIKKVDREHLNLTPSLLDD